MKEGGRERENGKERDGGRERQKNEYLQIRDWYIALKFSKFGF